MKTFILVQKHHGFLLFLVYIYSDYDLYIIHQLFLISTNAKKAFLFLVAYNEQQSTV